LFDRSVKKDKTREGEDMKTSLTKIFNHATKFVVMLVAFFAVHGTEVRAQAKVVAYNASNPYQMGRFSHVKRVLLYNYTLGGHSKTPLLNSMTRLANKYGFQLDIGGTSSYITNATLAMDSANPVNVVVMSNGDGDVLQDATSLAAMKQFVQSKGRGLLQTHAAAAYIGCPNSGQENLTDANCRWLARVLVRQYLAHDPDPFYGRIYVDSVQTGQVPPRAPSGTAAATIMHGKKNQEFKSIFDSLPSNDGIVGGVQPGIWDSIGDEWYNYRGLVRLQGAQTFDGVLFGPIVILLSQDESAPYYNSSVAKMGDRTQAWARHVGLGLTAYNNAGHSDVYTRARKFRNVAVRDSVIEKFNWRLIRYLARDFVGCMTPGDNNYNPEASVEVLTAGIDNATPCAGNVQAILKSGSTYKGIRLESGHIRVATSETGNYQILVVDAKGTQYFNQHFVGGQGKNVDVPALSKGQYFVHVYSPKGASAIGVNIN